MPYHIPSSTIAAMPPSKIRLIIELDPDVDPISGTLQQPHTDPAPFSGWLQLAETLETIRRAPGHEPPNGPQDRRSNQAK
jgi:hypothetical protein